MGKGAFALALCLAVGASAQERDVSDRELQRLIEQVWSGDAGASFQALRSIGELGPRGAAAVPALARLFRPDPDRLRCEEPDPRRLDLEEYPRELIPPQQLEDFESTHFGFQVALTLGKIGTVALPELLDVMKEPGAHTLAALAVSGMGPAALPALGRALRDEHAGVREGAAEALARMGLREDRARAVLFEALGSETAEVRAAGMLGVSLLGERAVPVLIDLLRSGAPGPRVEAAEALSRLQRVDRTALLELIGRDEPALRQRAAVALAADQEAEPRTTPLLHAALAGADEPLRVAATRALGRLMNLHLQSRTLQEALRDRNPAVRAAAATSLSRTVPLGADAARGLERAIHGEERHRTIAAQALTGLGTEGARALVGALREGSEPIRLAAVNAANARAAGANVEVLVAALTDRSAVVRSSALKGLLAATRERPPAVAPASLAPALEDQVGEIRAKAAIVLTHLRIEDDGLRARVVEALEHAPFPDSESGSWTCSRDVAAVWRAEEYERRGDVVKALEAWEAWTPIVACDLQLGTERKARRARGIATLRMGRGDVEEAFAAIEPFLGPEQMEIRPEFLGELAALHAGLSVQAGRFDAALARAGSLPHGLGSGYERALIAALERRREGEGDETTRRRIDELLAGLRRPK